MIETIYYLKDTKKVDTNGVSAVICATSNVAKFHKESCFKTDTAVLIENDVEGVARIGVDGVYFTADASIKDIKSLRKKDINIQIGMDCGVSKHIAMLVGESGADFVMFSGGILEVSPIVRWWGEMMEIPVVAWTDDMPITDESTLVDFIVKSV